MLINKIRLGFGPFLTLLFIILKLTHLIHLSWMWVLSPLWISFGLVIIGLAMLGGIVVAGASLEEKEEVAGE